MPENPPDLAGRVDDWAKLTQRPDRWLLQRLATDRMSLAATATAIDQASPEATKAMVPLHVVRLVAKSSQRLQRETTGRRRT
ncbi:hypothetical protein [Corynebacterium glyciniphilum]|uniref:hypothetical protein n=1 Tax=Corynebacterium glyciniphilum TaxID=1404244 RepID=UPI0021B19E80|nr:hypothetical protein [Corynebacterium glyciniphilum]